MKGIKDKSESLLVGKRRKILAKCRVFAFRGYLEVIERPKKGKQPLKRLACWLSVWLTTFVCV